MFNKGQSGNPNGRAKGSLNKASADWRDIIRNLIFDPLYHLELRKRLMAGTLPPLVETRMWAYAAGEPPKAPDEQQTGLVVNIGFLGALPSADTDTVPNGSISAEDVSTRLTQSLISDAHICASDTAAEDSSALAIVPMPATEPAVSQSYEPDPFNR